MYSNNSSLGRMLSRTKGTSCDLCDLWSNGHYLGLRRDEEEEERGVAISYLRDFE